MLEARRIRKHSTEYLREQADRSATSSTVAVVQAPCNTMTPVAPGLQLSSEANAIVAAISGALAPRLDGTQEQMGMLAGQMTSLKSDVVRLSAQVQHHDQRMSEFERYYSWKIRQIAASSEPHPELARGNGSVHPPKKST